MDNTSTPTGCHFYFLRNGNAQQPSSASAGDIPANPNDELSFQNSNNIVGRQNCDIVNIDSANSVLSTPNTAFRNYGAMSPISQRTQGLSPTPPQTIFGFPQIHIQGDMLLLVQHPYRSGLPLEHLQTVLAIHYGWVNLQAAFIDDFGDLADSDQLAWADNILLPPKLAIVLCFPGYTMYKRQVTVLRAHNQPPTRGAMARILAREMRKFLDKARNEYGRPLRWQGRELTLSDLFLIDIKQVSRGSLQPRIGIRGNRGCSGSRFAPHMNIAPT